MRACRVHVCFGGRVRPRGGEAEQGEGGPGGGGSHREGSNRDIRSLDGGVTCTQRVGGLAD